MPQLTENKQNEPVLIANFEPTHCARKSAQKVETRTRVSSMHMHKHKQRHRAGKAARKVEVQKRLPRHCAGEPAQNAVLGLTTLFRISRVLHANTRIDVWILGGGA
jgi:hypothetical protein